MFSAEHKDQIGNQESLVDTRKDRRTAGKTAPGVGGSSPYPLALHKEAPLLTTKPNKKRQPKGPPRGGMEEGPKLMDCTVMNGTDNHNEKILRKCTCGWQKVMKMKCGRMPNQHDHSAAGPSSAERATSAEVVATPESCMLHP
ncbi:hypothetical protein MHYP_G00042480 [Metynnis hypsauchen]